MKKIIQFIKECKRELTDRTTWPSKDEVLNSTIIVIISIMVVSLALGMIDTSLSWLNKFVLMENIHILQKFITPLNIIVFSIVAIVLTIIYNRIKKRLRQ